MKQKILISAICTLTILSGCNDSMENDTVSSMEKPEVRVAQTRAVCVDSSLTENLEEFIMSDSMIKMRELYSQLHSQHKKLRQQSRIHMMKLYGAICMPSANYQQQ